ncbi:restriction endonuclease subunit S [Photorhabdus heterorhabditis]|uniref:restriction endonuclease subunit S n=1 Tax=Photorhabdus heterorhabditis TaxID=880156 RepID=UPI001BD636B2|nr:restriction endonuclease subunit S [Photorhabdus heterorhabditis]MBS9443783.1 restriction endonuclease subunit S [Photorhabdus heterorhabditis]
MSRYKAYPEYKDSGVEWLGKVPSEWKLHSLKRTINGCTNGIWGNDPDGENNIVVIRVADFDRNMLSIVDDKLTYRSISDSEKKSRLLKSGDLLIEKSGGGEKNLVGCVVKFDRSFPAITSNFIAKMTPKKNYDSTFLTYAFHHLYERKVNYSSIKQTTGIQNLDSESYLQEYFCFPTFFEQKSISKFLNYETFKIDQLISKQKQLIELLKEKRQAVISHAVTKGLNPNVKMKNSGIEWLGEVPEHWRISPLKYNCLFSGGGTPSKDKLEYWNGDIPWVSPKDMKSFYISNSEDKITKTAIVESSTKLIASGAVLIVVRSGILQRTIPVAINTCPVTLNQDMKALIFKTPLNAEFFTYFIRGNETQLLLEWCKQGATVESIESEYLSNSAIPFPPSHEISQIISYLNKKMTRFNELEEKSFKSIELLKERRSALISAAVTGKIDVRDWQAAKDVA